MDVGDIEDGRATSPDEKRARMLRWGLPASLAAHLIVGAILLITLPVPENKAPDEPVVDVEIVPPPEEQAEPPQEQVEEQKTVEQEEPEAEQPEETPPEPEQAEEEQAPEEPEAEPPAPQEPEVQEPEAEEPQPEEAAPEPEPEPEQPEPEEQPVPEQQAEPEQPEEPAQPEQAPQPAEGEEQASDPMDTLRPVFEFGEENSGPREQVEGNSAEDGGLVEDVPEDIASPFEELTADVPTPSARPEDAPRISVAPNATLPEAKRLFSTEATGTPAATTAIANMSRGDRGADLCATELREQLRNGTPAYWPDLLPAYRLGEGTAIEVHDGAFRAGGAWFNLAFRCEVDPDVRRVVSFAIEVGDPIPRTEWQARGFPAF